MKQLTVKNNHHNLSLHPTHRCESATKPWNKCDKNHHENELAKQKNQHTRDKDIPNNNKNINNCHGHNLDVIKQTQNDQN